MWNFIAVDAIRYTYSKFTDVALQLKERNISNLKQKKAQKSQLAGGRPVGYLQA